MIADQVFTVLIWERTGTSLKNRLDYSILGKRFEPQER